MQQALLNSGAGLLKINTHFGGVLVKFEYKLSGGGWADRYLEIDNQECTFSASYMVDTLSDFLVGLVRIIPGCTSPDELMERWSFQIYEEPALKKCELVSLDNDRLQIQITHFDDENDLTHPEIIILAICSMNEFVHHVVIAIDQLIKQHGFIGYRNTWGDHDFPIRCFLQLKNYVLKTPPLFKYQEYTLIRHTNIVDELELLNVELK